MRKAALIELILVWLAVYFLGRWSGKRAADKWYERNPVPPLVLGPPLVPETWQVALGCSEAAVCLGGPEGFKVNPKYGWIICGITIEGKAKVIYGNGAKCPEVEARLNGVLER